MTFWQKNKTIVTTVLITVVLVLLFGAFSHLTKNLLSEQIENHQLETFSWLNAGAQVLLSAVVLFLMHRTGVFDREDFAASKIGRGLWLGLVGVLLAVFLFAINIISNKPLLRTPQLSYLLSGLFIAFTTGLFEELLLRGFTYKRFRQHFGSSLDGMKKAVLFSSLLFALIHLFNLTSFDLVSILGAISSMIVTFASGVFLCLVFIQSKSLWAVIIIHALIDAASFVLHSLLIPAPAQASPLEAQGMLGTIVQYLLAPVVLMLPMIIASIVKWHKIKKNFTLGMPGMSANNPGL